MWIACEECEHWEIVSNASYVCPECRARMPVNSLLPEPAVMHVYY